MTGNMRESFRVAGRKQTLDLAKATTASPNQGHKGITKTWPIHQELKMNGDNSSLVLQC